MAQRCACRCPAVGPALEAERELRYNQVGPAYLETLGTRLLRGRFFAPEDQASAARVVVIGHTLARQYFPDADHDPLALGASALAAVLLGAAASIGPAWRSVRIDPARTLRDQ